MNKQKLLSLMHDLVTLGLKEAEGDAEAVCRFALGLRASSYMLEWAAKEGMTYVESELAMGKVMASIKARLEGASVLDDPARWGKSK